MKKELHLAHSVEELNKLTERDYKGFKAHKLYISAEKLFKTGLESLHIGDEEKAYILFVRFLSLYDYLSRIDDKQLTKRRLGSEYSTATEQVERLKSSLYARYEEQKRNEIPTAKIIEEEAPEKKNRITFPGGYISCDELYGLLQKKIDILLLDARPSFDFNISNMKNTSCVNIPEEIISTGKSANILGKEIPEESREGWEKRWRSEVTVLLDWSSTKETITASRVSILKDIMVNWDTTMGEIQPVILNGGYLEWLQTYPMLCTNPDVVHEVQNAVLDDLLDLDSIEYPSTEETTPARFFKPPSLQPVVNRATKPVAAVNGVKPQQKIVDNAEKEIELKIIENEKNLEELKHQRQLEAEEAMRKELQLREEKLLEDQAALEKSKQELNKENEELKKKLQSLSIQNDSQNEIPLDTIKENDIREKLLQEAREKKKSLNLIDNRTSATDNKNEVEVPRPSPSFDRRSKPVSASLICLPGLTGLKNFGTTCYLNTIVQCLSNTGLIHEFFTQGLYLNVVIQHQGNNGTPISTIFGNLIEKLWSGRNKTLLPKEFKTIVNQYAPRYKSREHQDAHEFLISLNNWLHDDLKTDITRPKQVCWTPKERSWVVQTNGKYSVILDTFYGQVKNALNCDFCGKHKEKYELFDNLTIALPKADSCTLENCLESYFCKQSIPDYKCPQCQGITGVQQQLTVVSHAPVLLIVLKRFTGMFEGAAPEFSKNYISVRYPLDNLKVGNVSHNLYAVILHKGVLDRGHYIAVCKNIRNGRWYRYDDDRVTEVSKESAFEPTEAYMLFYQTVQEEQRIRARYVPP